MAADLNNKVKELEQKIKSLITSHQKLKIENRALEGEKALWESTLNEEKTRLKRIEEGYKELKTHERIQRNKNVETIKMKISGLVGEIDRNVALINAKNK